MRDIERFKEAILSEYPSMPDAQECAELSCQIGSGCVGRSKSAEDPVTLAVIAYARHHYTDYDELLLTLKAICWDGEEARIEARRSVRKEIEQHLSQWAKPKAAQPNESANPTPAQ